MVTWIRSLARLVGQKLPLLLLHKDVLMSREGRKPVATMPLTYIHVGKVQPATKLKKGRGEFYIKISAIEEYRFTFNFQRLITTF